MTLPSLPPARLLQAVRAPSSCGQCTCEFRNLAGPELLPSQPLPLPAMAIRQGGGQAYYNVSKDFVQMPPFEKFRYTLSAR